MFNGTVIEVLVRPFPAPPCDASMMTITSCAATVDAAASMITAVLESMFEVGVVGFGDLIAVELGLLL